MKTKLLLTVCGLLLGMSVQARDYKYDTVDGDLMKTRIYTLDNGLKVYLSVNKEKPRIQTYIAVRTGSKNDPSETTGLAHYLEHLMFKGTKQFGTNNYAAEALLLDEIEQHYETYRKLTDPEARKQAYHEIDSISQVAAQYFIPNEYDKLMAAIGAEGCNAYTSDDVTCYMEDIPSNAIENWAKIQADRFQNMVIRGFHTELEAVYEEFNISLTNDWRKLQAAMNKMLAPTHPYGLQTTIGSQEHLKNPSITNIKNYFNKWYRPNNVAICMAGDLDPEKTIAIIDQYFSSWQPGDDVRQPVFPQQPVFTQPRDTTVVGQEAEQIWMGWQAKQANSLQADTLELMEDVLNNGRAGLFDLNLVQKMKLQKANGTCQLDHDLGEFVVMGTPKEGQSLDEVKALLLAEIDKLKKGDFPDNLLPSIINNKKRRYYQSLERNEVRADMFVDAFINEIDWKDEVGKLDRISRITKQEIVDFANQFFTDGYAVVYKRQGVDSLQKKIDKPAITPIQANRDMKSAFVQAIQDSEVEPIHPRFVDFEKDLTVAKTKKGLPLYYVANNTNGLFELFFRYDFGKSADNRYSVAADYLDLLGTEKLSATEVRQKFYELACDMDVSVGADATYVYLYGLNENMQPALELLEDLMSNAKVDKEAYEAMVKKVLKNREDAKKNQTGCFNHLLAYGIYGVRSSLSDVLTEKQLKETDPQVFVDLLKNLSNYEHTANYYGPLSVDKISALVDKYHKTAKKLQAVPQNNYYVKQEANQNEVWIAPFDAKNIYMRAYHNENRDWHVDEAAVMSLFNEYLGGGMNGLVFQEMREARGLAYNAGAIYYQPNRKGETESFFTHIVTQNDKMMDCINHFKEIFDEMPASENAFNIAKEGLTKQLASLRITKENIIYHWYAMKNLGFDFDFNKKIYENLQKVTLQDIVDYEKANVANKPLRYLILGDEKELDMEALEKIGPIRRLTIEEIFGY